MNMRIHEVDPESDLGAEVGLQATVSFSKQELRALDELRGNYCERSEYIERQFIDVLDIANPQRAAELMSAMEGQGDIEQK